MLHQEVLDRGWQQASGKALNHLLADGEKLALKTWKHIGLQDLCILSNSTTKTMVRCFHSSRQASSAQGIGVVYVDLRASSPEELEGTLFLASGSVL